MPELPCWFRQQLPDPAAFSRMRARLRGHGLHTVCEGARCPNMGQCWNKGSVTFMVLGDICTRACGFCAVRTGRPAEVDADEPRRIAAAVGELGLAYVVLTSVTRDDLPDGGAGHFAATVRALKAASPSVRVELLVPDFMARQDAFEMVVEAGPDVIGHNLETVRRISKELRPQAGHERSLEALRILRKVFPRGIVKSGLMAGLGETDAEIIEALGELKAAGCDIVTVGQYLSPRADGRQRPVARFVEPSVFAMYQREGSAMGLGQVFAGPLVRSSFLADEVYERALEGADL
jgi:lipoyl synthase